MFHTPAHKVPAHLPQAGQIVNPEYKNPPHRVAPPSADFAFADHGSVCILTPLSADGRDWVRNHVCADAQYFGRGLVIEPRYADDILAGIESDGLEVA